MNDGPALRGVIPPVLTPLDASGGLDRSSFARLIEHMLVGGVHGLFVLGTNGEGAQLPPAVRRDVVGAACNLAAGRAPVLVGVSDPCLATTLESAHHAADCGAAAVVATGPYYLKASQPELVAYGRLLADRQPLPVVLYNIPQVTGGRFDVETVAALAGVPTIVGIKESSGDLQFLKDVRARVDRPDFSLLVGSEKLLAETIKLGGHGCVGGGANLLPRLFVDLYDAAVAGDAEAVGRLAGRVRLLDPIYRLGEGPTAVTRGLKAAAFVLGLCDARMAEPFRSASEAELQIIASHLQQAGV